MALYVLKRNGKWVWPLFGDKNMANNPAAGVDFDAPPTEDNLTQFSSIHWLKRIEL